MQLEQLLLFRLQAEQEELQGEQVTIVIFAK
jgi:hypothetical protein